MNEEKLTKQEVLKVKEKIKHKKPDSKILPATDLKPYHHNPRIDYSQHVRRLVESMKEIGFKPDEPLLVNLKTMEVIVGNCRLRAAQELDLQIPCMCYDELDPIEEYILNCEENQLRANLRPLEKAKQLWKFKTEFGYTFDALETQFKEDRSVIHRKVSIYEKCTDKIKNLYNDGKINEIVAYTLSKLKPSEQNAISGRLGKCRTAQEAEAVHRVFLDEIAKKSWEHFDAEGNFIQPSILYSEEELRKMMEVREIDAKIRAKERQMNLERETTRFRKRLNSVDQEEPIDSKMVTLLAEVFYKTKQLLEKNYSTLDTLSSVNEICEVVVKHIARTNSEDEPIDILEKAQEELDLGKLVSGFEIQGDLNSLVTG